MISLDPLTVFWLRHHLAMHLEAAAHALEARERLQHRLVGDAEVMGDGDGR